ncbi:MAG: sulfurtransferase TusA family protein [Deltaproteobacteria bacterium]|nr:sulfurtransferase TusA family protein [Deltaproteobacteria bacterium]
MSSIKADVELDCRGLSCPLPVLKTKKTVDGMTSGQVLKLISTDPGSVNDIHAWTRRTGNELVNHEHGGDEYTFHIRKK